MLFDVAAPYIKGYRRKTFGQALGVHIRGTLLYFAFLNNPIMYGAVHSLYGAASSDSVKRLKCF